MALFCCLVAPTTPSTKMNDNKSQRSSLIWQFSKKECLLCQKRPKDCRGKYIEFDETSHCPLFKKLSKRDDQLSPKDTSTSSWTTSQRLENVFYQNIRQWASSRHLVTVEANHHRLPNLLLRPQRQELTYTMWLIHDDDTLSASTVIGTGQTGSPLAEAEPEIEEETDLFLKTVAKSLWGLLCVLDNVVI